MGRVYLAERDDDAYRQQAAVKLVRGSVDYEEVIRRFRTERQVLANLQHPNIAHLLDGGLTEDGVPWFALDYIDGTDLTDWCDRHRLGIPERLRLFLDVCAAVAHAHERLIVHRDLKPANILVDGDGRVKLLDFGIARLLDDETSAATRATGLAMFTPEYAAPEQIRGEPPTTAVDIHALGLVLCELLTGCRPYRASHTTPNAVAHAILTQEPIRPSRLVGAASEPAASTISDNAARRGLTAARLRTVLGGDLDAVIMKAIRKEPERRYRTVRELADDVRAALDHRPVAARQGGRRYRAARFLKRHTLPAALAAAAVLALIGGLATALWQAHEARQQRDIAQREAATAERTLKFVEHMFTSVQPNESQGRGRDVTVGAVIDQAAKDVVSELADEPLVQTRIQLLIASVYGWLTRQDEREQIARNALETLELNFGTDAPELAPPLLELADALSFKEEHDAALAAAERACDVLAARRRPDDEDMLRCEYTLATMLGFAGKNIEAIELLGSVITRLEPKSEQHLKTFLSNVYNNLGAQLLTAGDLLGSRQAHESAFAIRREVFTAPHSNIALSLNNISNILYYEGNLLSALDYAQQSLSMYEALGQPDFIKVTEQRYIVTQLLEQLGRFEEADALYPSVVNGLLEKRGPEHTLTLQARAQYGRTLVLLNRFEEAAAQLAEAERVADPNRHGRVLGTIMLARGEAALAMHDWAHAADLCEQAVSLRRSVNVTAWRVAESQACHDYARGKDGDASSRTALAEAVGVIAGKLPTIHFSRQQAERYLADLNNSLTENVRLQPPPNSEYDIGPGAAQAPFETRDQ